MELHADIVYLRLSRVHQGHGVSDCYILSFSKQQCTYSAMDLIFSDGGIKIGTAILCLLVSFTVIQHGLKLASAALLR